VKHPKLILRLLHINWILVTHGLDDLILKTHFFRPLRYFGIFSPNFWRQNKLEARGVRIRRTLEDLGPIYIKFGQALSTRKDILPNDIADELVKLQDKVPPFSDQQAREIIEKELGMSITDAFADFSSSPLASASIAQVHAATLHSGENVIVKVLRPDVENWIHSDIGILYELGNLAEKFWDDAKRLHPKEIVAEFEKTLLNELDLVMEAGNCSKLRNNFKDSESLYVPEIYWQLTRKKILVMERIYGIPVGEIDTLRENNADFKTLAERGVEIFFTQVFRDNFFHADMHPGNVFVDLPDKYIAVDFGIMGTLTPSDQRYLAENLLGFFNRDYHRVAKAHIDSGWVPPDTRVEEFESAIRSVCEPIFDKPLKDISFGLLLLRLFQTARRFNMEVQPQLVLLQKTLLNIEGLGRQLYPDLDLWSTAKPFLEDWFKERLSPKSKIKQAIQKFPEITEKFPEIPNLIFQALDDAAHSSLRAQQQQKQMQQLQQQIQHNHKRTIATLLLSSLVISSAIFWS
jgi:ubiquinone biosynthesis protein